MLKQVKNTETYLKDTRNWSVHFCGLVIMCDGQLMMYNNSLAVSNCCLVLVLLFRFLVVIFCLYYFFYFMLVFYALAQFLILRTIFAS